MAGYIGAKQGVTQVDGYNRAEADAEFVQVTGDTMTGALIGTNLTLSGGVYLGGTGAANTLDDYEEGTFTSTVTYDTDVTDTSPDQTLNVTGRYVKVGKICIVTWPYFTTATFGTGRIIASASLPFTVASGNEAQGSIYPYIVRGRYSGSTSDNANFATRAVAGGNTCAMSSAYPTYGGGWLELFQANSYFSATIVYETA